MSSFPKATRSNVADLPTKKSNDRKSGEVSQEVTQKPSLHLLVTALQEKEKEKKSAVSAEPPRSPLSVRRLRHDGAQGHGHEKHPHHAHTTVNADAGHEKHPHHAHIMVDDHLKTPLDHSVHWTQLLVAHKPHKRDFMDKAKDMMQRLKKNDDVLERLKEDPTRQLQQAALMSRVAGHIVIATEQEAMESKIQEQARKTPPRTAKSLKRDAAIDKLAKVMDEHHKSKQTVGVTWREEDNERSKNEEASQNEEQEEEESWKMLAFDESPARKHEHKDTYTIITQRRKASRPNTPGRERQGEHPLDLIGVLEVMPHTPRRAQPVERDSFIESITVHASDFIKHGDDLKMLKTLKLGSPSISEPLAVGNSQLSNIDPEQSRSHCVPGNCITNMQIPHSPDQSASVSRPGSRLASRPTSRPLSARTSTSRPRTAGQQGHTWPPSQPRTRPSSARTSRPAAARQHGEAWAINWSSSRASPEKRSCLRKSRPTPFLPLKGQSEQR